MPALSKQEHQPRKDDGVLPKIFVILTFFGICFGLYHYKKPSSSSPRSALDHNNRRSFPRHPTTPTPPASQYHYSSYRKTQKRHL